MRKYIILNILLVTLFACSKESEIDMVPYEPKVVVEGQIENDRYASVLLSISASMTGPKDTLSLLNHAIKSAKVTVSDETDSEILILQSNNSLIPPYEYVGSKIKGEVGKRYNLKIEYGGKIITASTYIPQAVSLNKIWFDKKDKSDLTGYIHVSFINTSNEYYLISSHYADKKVFIPCLYGSIDSQSYPKGEEVTMQINKGPVIFPQADYTTSFETESSIFVKFSTQTKDSYQFWISYHNEILNTQNPIFPANTSLTTNIEGGIGIWGGYNSYIYKVDPSKM